MTDPRNIEWGDHVRMALLETAREVVRTYEATLCVGGTDLSVLAKPIVKLRALLWRIDGVITEADDRMDAGL